MKQVFLILMIFGSFCLESFTDTIQRGKVIESGLIEIVVPDSVLTIKIDEREIPHWNNKAFVGFSRKDTLSQTIQFIFENQKQKTIPLNLDERTYNLQYIDRIPSQYVERPVDEELIARIRKEFQIITAVRENIIFSNKNLYFKEIIQPVEGRFSSLYGDQRILNNTPQRPHYGLDIAAPTGTPVVACSDGVVVLHDHFYYNGKFILLDHGLGLSSIYVHLNEVNVHLGQFVVMGEIIGTVGKTGRASGPHLHWGFYWFEKALDPHLVFETFEQILDID